MSTENLTPRVVDLLKRAGLFAEELGANYTGTEHVLMAMMTMDFGLAAKVLDATKIDRRSVINTIAEWSKNPSLVPADDSAVQPAHPKRYWVYSATYKYGDSQPSSCLGVWAGDSIVEMYLWAKHMTCAFTHVEEITEAEFEKLKDPLK